MNKETINQLKEIINKYPDKRQEILLYIFGRDNLVKMINEPTYEQLHDENQQLKEQLEKIKQPTIFIDTQDMEERYGEQLYQDYLVEQNKDLQQRIDKAIAYIEQLEHSDWITFGRKILLEILKGTNQ